MARSVRRRKKQRFYWAEIGFLILGLIALRPSLVADLAAMTRPVSTGGYQSVYDRGYPAMDSRYDDLRYAPPYATSHHAAYWPQYDARVASYPAVQHSNRWEDYQLPSSPTQQPSSPWLAWQAPATLQPNSASSNVAWPNAQVHQLVHNGATAPHLASPAWPTTVQNPSYYPYPSTAPASTGRY